jgi:hypothetical protein
MDPVVGDIFKPGTLHKYIYAQSDPANRIDPSGRDDIEEEGVVSEVTRTAKPAEELRGDVCYELYLEATAQCGENITDDSRYEKCMEKAWFNLFRCREGLPPIF